MRSIIKPALIGAVLALCVWGVNGLRDAPASSTLASAAPTGSTADSPSLVRLLDRGVADSLPAAPPAVLTEQRIAPAVPRVGIEPGALPREATSSVPAIAAPIKAAASVSLPPGVTMEDVAISPTGMVAVLRRAPTSTPQPDDGPGYGAAAVPGRPAVARLQ